MNPLSRVSDPQFQSAREKLNTSKDLNSRLEGFRVEGSLVENWNIIAYSALEFWGT